MNAKSALALFSLSLLIACGGGSEKSKNLQLVPEPSMAFARSGLECQLVSDTDSKPIYLKLNTQDGVTTVSFHELISDDVFSPDGVVFEGYTLKSFNLVSQKTRKANILSGEGEISHQDPSILSLDSKVVSIVGRLSFDKDMKGTLEQQQTVLKGQKRISQDFQELARIENCGKSEAQMQIIAVEL